jgi:hypothetical protein
VLVAGASNQLDLQLMRPLSVTLEATRSCAPSTRSARSMPVRLGKWSPAQARDPSRQPQGQSRRTLRAAGAKLFFLPPYSPDLNPIEMAFAKLKGAFRNAQARTIDGVVGETARALPTVSAKECAGYFRHASYASI